MDTKKESELVDDKTADIFELFDDVLAAEDIEFRTVKAWGGKFARIGSLTAGQLITFLENNDQPALRRINGLILIAQSLVNKTGKRLVNTKDEAALKAACEQLKDKDAKINGEVVKAILELNGMSTKDAKEIAKNASGEAPSGSSPTALH